MNAELDWPLEITQHTHEKRWFQAHSNICLDFHGDPRLANCVVFSDGNHHMALQESLQAFNTKFREAELFYATTPPNVLLDLIQEKAMLLGNLKLSLQPHLFIGPQAALRKLLERHVISEYHPFMQSQGVALLVKKGNPKCIRNLADILGPEVVLAISNRQTEQASYQVYYDSFIKLAEKEQLAAAEFKRLLDTDSEKLCYSQSIHHREIPQLLAQGKADVALLYYHLALRFSRVFPQHLEMVPLGNGDDPGAKHSSICTRYYMATMADPGPWGNALFEFLNSQEVTEIYRFHGLDRGE